MHILSLICNNTNVLFSHGNLISNGTILEVNFAKLGQNSTIMIVGTKTQRF